MDTNGTSFTIFFVRDKMQILFAKHVEIPHANTKTFQLVGLSQIFFSISKAKLP